MNTFKQVKGILFDYGGTIDSNGMHWAEVIWMAYELYMVPISKEVFREAYVFGERTLAKNPIIKPQHTFRDMLRIKTGIQMQWLLENHKLVETCFHEETSQAIAEWCYNFAKEKTEKAREVIQELALKYPMVLVSNFYGNIESVLKDFKLERYFDAIIESAVVGVRKPDPEIFRLGIQKLKMNAEDVVVIGDAYDKDIIPASSLGCHTIWLKNIGWDTYNGNEKADAIISNFQELPSYLLA